MGLRISRLNYRIAWWPLVGCRQLSARPQVFVSPYPHKAEADEDTRIVAPAVFVIHEVAAVGEAIQGGNAAY